MWKAKGRLVSLLSACLAALLTLVMGVVTLNVQPKTALAAETTIKYTFSEYTAGTQYADNEEHVLDDNVTIITTDCYFTSELRMYGSQANAHAIIQSKNAIKSITLNAGNKADTLIIYGSADDGSTWTEVGTVATSSTYKDYTVDINGTTYTCLKLDLKGTSQVRIKYIKLTTIDSACEHDYSYTSNNNGTHIKTCTNCSDVNENEDCVYGEDNICDSCGYEAPTYTLTFNVPNGIAAVEAKTDIVAMSTVTLPTAENKDEYTFEGWVTEEVSVLTEKPECYKGEYQVTASTTFYALYSYNLGGGSGTGNYKKVTDSKDDWSGEYLIVYEAESFIFDGSLSSLDAANNYKTVTIENREIVASDEVNAATFTVESVTDGYSIKSASGKYIGRDSASNGMNTGTTAYVNTFKIVEDGAAIVGKGGYHLRFNTTSGQDRFRYYSSSSQNAVVLYEKDGTGGTVNYTTSFSECEHTTTETVTVNATCTEAGYTYEKCSACGVEIENTRVDYEALGHEFTECVETVLPTETEQGYDVYKCVRCEETEKQNFVDPTTEYTVEFVVPDGIEAVPSITDAVGSVITLPTANTILGVKFLGWITAEYAENEACPELLTDTYTLTENKTLYALYTYTQGTGDFVKVTEEKTDWSGEYLIVYEDGENAYVFNGVDANDGYVSATTVNGKIAKSSELNTFTVQIATMEGGYSILSYEGYLYGDSGNNRLNFNKSTEQLNEISFNKETSAVSIKNGRYLRFNLSDKRFRYYNETYGKDIVLYEKDGATYYSTTLPTLTADIDTASLTIGTDLAMNYYVNMSDVYAAAQMKFSMEGLEDVYVNGVKQADGRYKFTFAAIPPQAMGDNISAELIFGDNTIATKGTYSIKTYAQNMLNNNPSDELKQLLTDMLYYGAAAQNYTNYNTASLAINGVKNLGTASTATPDSTDFKLENNTEIASYPAYFAGATVWFDNVNRIRVKINTTENVTLTINGEAVEVTGTTIDTEGILATDFDKTYTFVLSYNGDVMQTLTYSINAYAYAKQGDAEMGELALALYRYGASAEAYAN